MVTRKLLRAILAVLILGLMASCGFFTASTFPATATQLAAQRDLSGEIPASFSNTFTLSTVTTAGGIDLVFLANPLPYDGPHLIVMDRDLNVLQNLSYQDLISYSAAFSNNTAALLGASDDVLILGLDCAVTAAGLAGFAPNNPSPFIGPFSFTDGSLNYASFSVTGNQMGFTVYSNAWGFGSAPGGLISTNPSLNFQLIGVSGDPTRTDVAFILEETTTGQDYYFLIPRAAFPSALLFPLQSNYPWFTTPRSDNRLTAYSQNGFISFQRANNQSGGTFIRLDMAGNTLSDSLRYTDDTDIQIATRIGGGWYYVFNRTTRVLSKITAWWGK